MWICFSNNRFSSVTFILSFHFEPLWCYSGHFWMLSLLNMFLRKFLLINLGIWFIALYFIPLSWPHTQEYELRDKMSPYFLLVEIGINLKRNFWMLLWVGRIENPYKKWSIICNLGDLQFLSKLKCLNHRFLFFLLCLTFFVVVILFRKRQVFVYYTETLLGISLNYPV